ncbi:hypothetical protein A2935_00015 [Candidatus Wolfebacteria bacterium RIFCSPLOWO2_01_FULL_47_17b]|uniref:Uncharacterized protein n=1 Tax=Candidatus Wolfebacteria bacterium RIFCSPLOWO2_01_FULL_47_17b TaxID=1802558 RepID=A0A1F8DVA8_9BACT|nr:MAG: hypothetical protein A2935_00015 [Candidatus Wolfebacteria bacterium RIFCSPLOWO2_01_FULL_47_17b]
MTQKNTITSLLVILVLITTISYFMIGDGFGICTEGAIKNRGCLSLLNDISEPIFYSSISLLLVVASLFFVRREVFIAWAKFAAVAFPLMLGILLYTYNDAPMRSGFGLSGLISNEQFATAILPSLFFLVSLIIIIVKSKKK